MDLHLFTKSVEVRMDSRRIYVISDKEMISSLCSIIGSMQCAHEVAKSDPQTVVNICGDLAQSVPWPKLAWCWRSRQNIERIASASPSGTFRYSSDEATTRARGEIQRQFENYRSRVQLGARAKAGEIVIEHSLKMPPFNHQKMLCSFIAVMKRAGVYADCGVGKTYVAIWLADWLKAQRGSVKMLVVAPLSILERAWGDDIKKFSDLVWVNLWDVRKSPRKDERDRGMKPSDVALEQRRALLDSHVIDVYLANPELVRNDKLFPYLVKKRFDAVVVDEASLLKNAQSARFKAIFKVSAASEYRILMTGTPSPNGLLDIWPLTHWMDRGETLDYSMVDFREDFARFEQRGADAHQGKWVPKAGALDRAAPIISRTSVRVDLEDVIDMPPYVRQVRLLDMTPEQKRAYKTMREQLFLELEGETLDARNQLEKMLRLRQVTGGFIYTPDAGEGRGVIEIKNNPKLAELDLVLSEIGPHRKVLVWAQHRAEIEAILARYPDRQPIALYGGSGSQKRRDREFERFRDDPACTLSVMHPKAAAYGLTMTQARWAVSYAIDHSYELDYQKGRRNWRSGQTETCVNIYLAMRGTIDVSCLAAQQAKSDLESRLIPRGFDRAAYTKILEGRE
jgi:SNF2 family DNA or RNA helicase